MGYIGKFKDLTGQKFGKLTVLRRDKNKKVMWLCRCDCGNYHTVIGSNLTKGLCKSCGCLAAEKNKQRRLCLNRYDLSGEYGIGYTNKNEIFYFDKDDYDKIKEYSWYKNSLGYIVTNISISNIPKRQVSVKMHRLVMDAHKDQLVDHIYHIKHDNRKSQLRIVTNQQNQFNSNLRQDNTTGVSGVYWHKNKHKWESLIGYNKKIIYLGMYDDFDEAVKVRKEAEKLYYKEHRNQRV